MLQLFLFDYDQVMNSYASDELAQYVRRLATNHYCCYCYNDHDIVEHYQVVGEGGVADAIEDSVCL